MLRDQFFCCLGVFYRLCVGQRRSCRVNPLCSDLIDKFMVQNGGRAHHRRKFGWNIQLFCQGQELDLLVLLPEHIADSVTDPGLVNVKCLADQADDGFHRVIPSALVIGNGVPFDTQLISKLLLCQAKFFS